VFVIRTAVTIRKNQAEFVQSYLAAIEATKRDGNGVQEAKLTAAKLDSGVSHDR